MSASDHITKAYSLGHLVYNNRNIISVHQSTPVEQVLNIMHTNNIVNVPVTNDEGQFLGFVSVQQIMTFIAFGVFSQENPTPEQFDAFVKSSNPIGDLLDLDPSGVQSIWVFEPEKDLFEVLEVLSKGIKQVLVIQRHASYDKQRTYRILSQSDVVRFLVAHNSEHQQRGNTPNTNLTIDALGVVHHDKSPVSIKTSDTALHGFRSMDMNGVSAVPVVCAETGRIVTTLSPSDLRGLAGLKEVREVLLPVTEFLRNRRGGRLTHPVTCTKDSTLEEVMLKAVTAGVHRVWVVDASGKPISVVSLTDIIHQFFNAQ